MRKFYGVIMTIMLIFSYSCTKNEIIIQGVDDPSTLKIQLVTPTTSTRATGYDGDSDYNEGRIKTATIGVFYEDGSLNVIKEISFNEGTATKAVINLMSGANQTIWVIANIEESVFNNITTKNAFENVLIDLIQTTDNISMSGNIVMNIPAGEELESTVNLKRLPFKISVPSIVKDFTKGGYPNATFKINEVMLFNVNSKSTITNIGSDPVSGDSVTELCNYSEVGFESDIRHFFYGMPGDTRLIIGGLFTNNGREQYVYYPIDIKDALNNYHYEMKLTLTGPGVTNPADDYDPAKLNLKLQVVDWDSIKSEHEF